MYLMKSIWRAYLIETHVCDGVRGMLIRFIGQISDKEDWRLLARLIAWFNLSVTAFGKP